MIEFATHDDIPTILELLRDFKNESPWAQAQFDEEKTTLLITSFIEADKTSRACMVYRKDGEIVGLLAAAALEVLFSKELMTTEVIWYVRPEYRKSRVGLDIFKIYMFWAEKIGAKFIQTSLASGPYAERVGKFYEKNNLQLIEKVYMRTT